VVNESVLVKCSVIGWFLWALAGVLLLAETIRIWVAPGGVTPGLGPLAWWGLYVVAGAAVWSIEQAIGAATRRVVSKLERLERTQQGTPVMTAKESLRSLR
jgi:hypothetical protein